MKFCTKCGKELNDEDLFCPKCGTKQIDVEKIKNEKLINKKEYIPTLKNSIILFALYLLFYIIIFCNYTKIDKVPSIIIVYFESSAIIPLFIIRLIRGKINNSKKEFVSHLCFSILIHFLALLFSIIVLAS